MGTRSIIKFIDKHGDIEHNIATIYQQYDGYLEGVGRELCEWLSNKIIINGIGIGQESYKYANGIGCLAAQFVRDFIGWIYLVSPDSETEAYNYEVIYDNSLPISKEGSPADKMLKIKVSNFDHPPFFEGSPSELLQYIINVEKGT